MKKESKPATQKISAKNFRRQLCECREASASERPCCVLSNRMMGVAEPKVLIDDLGYKVYASEEAFFRDFAFRICDKKNARPNRKHFAAREIPGLAKYKGSRGVCWRLSYRQLARDLPLPKLEVLLKLVDRESPLFRRIRGADERNRFFSDSLH